MRRPVQVQHIELHFSRLRMVLTPPFCERFGRWCVDGWGDARIYSYYILIWIYRLEHLISIRVDGLDVAMLDAALGFAPLIHLKTAHLAFDSRYTWHAPLFHVAYASPPATWHRYTVDQQRLQRLAADVQLEYNNGETRRREPHLRTH